MPTLLTFSKSQIRKAFETLSFLISVYNAQKSTQEVVSAEIKTSETTALGTSIFLVPKL